MQEVIGKESKNMTHLEVEVNANVVDIKTKEEFEKDQAVQDKVTDAAKKPVNLLRIKQIKK